MKCPEIWTDEFEALSIKERIRLITEYVDWVRQNEKFDHYDRYGLTRGLDWELKRLHGEISEARDEEHSRIFRNAGAWG